MTSNWKIIIVQLRQELVEYGALLTAFDDQQKALFSRQPDIVLHQSTAIKEQLDRVVSARNEREQAVGEFAVAHKMPVNATLRSLLPFIDKDAHPLFEALIGEINLLLHRVRRTHRQNHTLLNHTVSMHRETLQMLRPNSFTKTYSPAGIVSVSSGRVASTLCVAG
ncbi:MAG TPA: flagellar protein FlgN [Opitutaceae bacterium]|jgi:flagellar biosynthesis/type III secretory pathway chaperone|nr:flagellar protein FlgN [Opitutaceae bacterium]